MKRWSSVLPLALLLSVACTTTQPAPTKVATDPTLDPTIIGAVDEAVAQGLDEGAEAARVGRRVGRVAGVIAAIVGGPSHESLDDTIDRYRDTRDAVTATAAVIGATHGATEGAKRGFQMDLQFAELTKVQGLDVIRPFPDQIDVRFRGAPTHELVSQIATVLKDRDARAISIEGSDDYALDVRDWLLELGVGDASVHTHRNDALPIVVLHINYKG
jgi:hypothetical protein